MNAAVIAALAAPAGALVGLGAGWLSVVLERVEDLEREEREDREAFVRERDAMGGGDADGDGAWTPERYGWTWLERVLCPLLGAAGFTAFAVHEGLSHGLAIHLLWIALFVHVVAFDLKHRLILNRVSYPAVVVALGLSFVSPGLTFVHALAGCVIVGGFFLLLNIASRGGIGRGDAKLGALVGAVCGLSLDLNHVGAVYAVVDGIFLGGLVAFVLLVLRIRRLRDPIPYGPFLCIGASVILFLGP